MNCRFRSIGNRGSQGLKIPRKRLDPRKRALRTAGGMAVAPAFLPFSVEPLGATGEGDVQTSLRISPGVAPEVDSGVHARFGPLTVCDSLYPGGKRKHLHYICEFCSSCCPAHDVQPEVNASFQPQFGVKELLEIVPRAC